MFFIANVLAVGVCLFSQVNGFSLSGRASFDTKSSLQMNDIRKTENKRDRSLAGILGVNSSAIYDRENWSYIKKTSHRKLKYVASVFLQF